MVAGRWEDTAGRSFKKGSPQQPVSLFQFRGDAHWLGLSKAPTHPDRACDVLVGMSETCNLVGAQVMRGPDRLPQNQTDSSGEKVPLGTY